MPLSILSRFVVMSELLHNFIVDKQWARERFEDLFKMQIENANLYLTTPNFVEETMKQGNNTVRPLVIELQIGLI